VQSVACTLPISVAQPTHCRCRECGGRVRTSRPTQPELRARRLGRHDQAIDSPSAGCNRADDGARDRRRSDLRVLHRHPRFAQLVGLDVSLASQAWQTWLDQPSRVFADACYRLLASTDPGERPVSLLAEVTSLIRTGDSEPGRGCAADGALMHWASEFGDVLFHDLTWLRTRLTEPDGVEALDLLRALITLRYDDKLRDRARQLVMSERSAIRARIVDATTDANASVGIEALMEIVRELRMVEARDEVRALLTELGRRPERVDYLVAYVLPALAVVANPSDLDDFLVWRDDRRPLVARAGPRTGAFGQSTSQTRQIRMTRSLPTSPDPGLGGRCARCARCRGVHRSAAGGLSTRARGNVSLAIAEAVTLSGDDRVVLLVARAVGGRQRFRRARRVSGPEPVSARRVRATSCVDASTIQTR
jgi:hypothetical protein